MRIVQSVVKAQYDTLKKAGESDEDIQKALKELIRNVRFFEDNSGYIFVYKYDGTNVLFPLKPQLEGKNLNHLKDKNGGGIVSYLWPKKKDGEPQLKFSYALSFEPYGWMMGAGVYVDNVEKELAAIEVKTGTEITKRVGFFIMVAFGLVILNIFLNIFLVRKNITNPLNNLIERTKKPIKWRRRLNKKT